ncbi:hypothetical protein LQW54_003832 [Pestalotiopsis sp. IQ-011]
MEVNGQVPASKGESDHPRSRDAPKKLRQLSNNEAYQLALYQLGQYRGTSVSCRYVIPPQLRGSLELRRTVEAAVAETVLQHPVLQVAIKDAHSAKATWIELDSLDMKQHITWTSLDLSQLEGSVQEIITEQIDATYPELDKRPGWRLVIMHQEQLDFLEILFTWNHPHADGMSGKIFQADLSRNLNSVDRSRMNELLLPDGTLKLPSSQPQFPPRVEDLAKLPITPTYTVKSIWKEYGPAMLNKDPNQAHWAPIRTTPYKTNIRVFSFNSDALSKILAACRQKQTTLTGLLHGLALVSLALRLGADEAPGFHTKTAIDLRRFLPSGPEKYPWFQPERTMGNYVTVIGHLFPANSVTQVRSERLAGASNEPLSANTLGHIWTAAAQAREEILHKLEDGLKNDIVGLMRFVGNWQTQMSDTAHKPREYAVFVTNLGSIGEGVPPPDTAPESSGSSGGWWVVNRAQFSLSAEVASAALMISIMSAHGGQLCFAVTWQESVISTTLGEGFTADIERWLGEIAI